MSISQFLVSGTATAAVLCYTTIVTPTINTNNYNHAISFKAPKEMSIERSVYKLEQNNQEAYIEQIEIIHKFASNILDNIKEFDPDFIKTVDNNIWDMV